MIKFSTFARYKGENAISICDNKNWCGEVCKELIPTEKITQWWMGVDQNEYKNKYIYFRLYHRDVLSKLNPHLVGKILEGKVLLTEEEGVFSHKYIIIEWLKKYGFEVKEIL